MASFLWTEKWNWEGVIVDGASLGAFEDLWHVLHVLEHKLCSHRMLGSVLITLPTSDSSELRGLSGILLF